MPIQLLTVGRILRPQGVRGEMVLETLTTLTEPLAETETVYVGEAAEPHLLRRSRLHRGRLIIQLEDCVDRNAAEALRGQLVQIRAEAVPPLPPGRYYHRQIIGLDVVTEAGEPLGAVKEILETGANDVYVVEGPAGEILLPALRSVILKIDLPGHQMTVKLMEGLRPEPGA